MRPGKEPVYRSADAFLGSDFGLPRKCLPSSTYNRTAACGVIGRKRLVRDLGCRSRSTENEMGEFRHTQFLGITEVNGSLFAAIDHPQDSAHQIVNVAKTPGLRPSPYIVNGALVSACVTKLLTTRPSVALIRGP